MSDFRRASHYGELLNVVRERIAELNVPYETVDVIAGFPSWYTSKLLSIPPRKNMSAYSLALALSALLVVFASHLAISTANRSGGMIFAPERRLCLCDKLC